MTGGPVGAVVPFFGLVDTVITVLSVGVDPELVSLLPVGTDKDLLDSLFFAEGLA